MRKVALSLIASLVVLVPVVHAAPVEVLAKDDFFKPKKVTIKKDRSVLWRWRGDNPHNVAIKRPGSNKVVKRSAIKTEGTYRYKFRRTGTWKVLCEVHPRTMTMKVVVTSP